MKLERQLEDWTELKNLGNSLTGITGGVQQNVAVERYRSKLNAYFINYGSFNARAKPTKYSGKK